MADDETKVRDDLWWAIDASPDTPPSDATFDEPLEWPDALPWEEFAGDAPPSEGFPLRIQAEGPIDVEGADLLFPPVADAEAVVEADRMPAPPAGLAGAAAPTAPHLEALPDSIWAPDAEPALRPDVELGALGAGVGTVVDPTVHAEAERPAPRRWPPGFAVPRGNAAVIALISFVSLVLLGMFLSVRSRTTVPSDSSGTPRPQADISVTGPLNTVPLSTVTTSPSGPAIALSDLLPPPETDTSGSGAAAGTTPRAATTTTAAPRATAAPAGSGAAQPTVTTAAPEPEPTTPAPTPPPSDDTTTPTTRKTTPTTADIPRPSVSFTMPSTTWPAGVPRPPGR